MSMMDWNPWQLDMLLGHLRAQTPRFGSITKLLLLWTVKQQTRNSSKPWLVQVGHCQVTGDLPIHGSRPQRSMLLFESDWSKYTFTSL